jgi:hypothetical protein
MSDTPYTGMSIERFDALMEQYDDAALTPAERDDGWHFCTTAWDGLLIHPVDAEYKFCTCSHAQSHKRSDSYYESLLNFRNFLKENPNLPLDGTPDEWYNTHP